MVAGSRALSLWREHKLDWAWSDYKSSGNTWNALSQFCNSATLRLSICPPTSPEVTLVTNCTLETCIFHILYIWHICNWCFAALWFMLSDGFLVITCLYLLPGVIHNMAEVPSILLGNRSMHGCSIWLFPGKRWSTPGRCEYSISSWWPAEYWYWELRRRYSFHNMNIVNNGFVITRHQLKEPYQCGYD